MAGRGPAPKDPSKRARRNAGPGNTVISIAPDSQPALSDLFGVVNPATDDSWHPATVMFWGQLRTFPTTCNLIGAQWTLLGVAMMLFDRVVSGKLGYAEEMRREFAAFGISPADVARLRITFAVADEAEDRRDDRRSVGSSSRYSQLRALDADDDGVSA